MKLYHGSNVAVTKIDLQKSRPNKDFGKGFYLSDNISQAIVMAEFKVSLFGGEPIVSQFIFDKEGLFSSGLRVKIFEDYSLEWVDFVIANREGTILDEYDFVYGPIANDKVGVQLRNFKYGSIDKKELLQRLKYMKGITFQYFFGSSGALNYLKPI